MHETTHFSYNNGTVNIQLGSDSLSEIAAPDFRFEDYNRLVKACFNTKQLQTISDGETADISFNLTLSDDIENSSIKSRLSKAREKEEATLGKLTESVYMDFSLNRSLSPETAEEPDSFYSDCTMQIDIPLYLISEGRSYWLMTEYMGKSVLLPDLDNEPDSITIEARSMTTGVLLYQDPLDSLTNEQAGTIHIQKRYFFIPGILLLIGLWFFINHLHKKSS